MITHQKRVTATAFVLSGVFVHGQCAWGQDQLWQRQFGTPLSDEIRGLTPSPAGGVLVAGTTQAYGGFRAPYDGIVARYDDKGNQLWLRQFGSSETEFLFAIASDGVGGAMVAGWTEGRLGSLNAGLSDVLLARFDSDGNQLWIRQIGTEGSDEAFAASPDGSGGVIIAGDTTRSLAAPNSLHSDDPFIARFDADGNQLWIRQFGTTSTDTATALATDEAGGAFVAGHTGGDLGGPSAGVADVFIARYSGDGDQLWIRQFGTERNEFPWALAPDGNGGAYLAGDTNGDLAGIRAGSEDAFLARYDSAGNQLWIRQFGTSNRDVALALAPDGMGGVFVTGDTGGELGGPTFGGRDGFLGHFAGDGTQLSFRQFGSTDQENTFALAQDGAGGVVLAGRTSGSLAGPNQGSSDAFMIRYGDSGCYYASCDTSTGTGVFDIFDFLCFQSAFVKFETYADCDGNNVLDIFDFLCFQSAFVGGCP